MMNRQITFNLFNGKNQVQGKISILVLGLVMLLPVALTACLGVLPNEPVQSEAVESTFEGIQVATESEAVTASTFYAANPELMVADRYATIVEDETKSGSAFFAANPELMAADRYKTLIEDEPVSESTFYATNPELMAVDRYGTKPQ